MYKALSHFTDLQDNGYTYHAGDKYPRKGYEPSKARIEELSTDKNRRGVPVIAKIDDISPNKGVKTEKGTIAPEDCINPPIEADNDDLEAKPEKAEPKKRTRKAKSDVK